MRKDDLYLFISPENQAEMEWLEKQIARNKKSAKELSLTMIKDTVIVTTISTILNPSLFVALATICTGLIICLHINLCKFFRNRKVRRRMLKLKVADENINAILIGRVETGKTRDFSLYPDDKKMRGDIHG